MKLLYYLLALLLVFILSCNKEEESAPDCMYYSGHYPISSDLLNCKYKTGTYWVFIDSVSNAIDSVYVNTFSQGLREIEQCNASWDYHNFSTMSYPSGIATNYFIEVTSLNKGGNGAQSGVTVYLDYNIPLSNLNHNLIIARFDSMFIYNQYYYNVSKSTIVEGNDTGIYYMNSDYGFLRIDIIDSSNVTLSKKILQQKNIIR